MNIPGTGAAPAGYTRTVTWKRSLSVVILAVLTTLPMLGAICATECEAAGASAGAASVSGHHHSAAHHAEASASLSVDTRIQGVSAHNCSSHEAALWQASTAASERADGGITSLPPATNAAVLTLTSFAKAGRRIEGRSAPDAAPPPIARLVLRV